jgi:hypothetical protein
LKGQSRVNKRHDGARLDPRINPALHDFGVSTNKSSGWTASGHKKASNVHRTQNRPPIRVLLVGLGPRATKVKPAVYAANIESCGDCWMAVYLDRQHSAFPGTNPELGWK